VRISTVGSRFECRRPGADGKPTQDDGDAGDPFGPMVDATRLRQEQVSPEGQPQGHVVMGPAAIPCTPYADAATGIEKLDSGRGRAGLPTTWAGCRRNAQKRNDLPAA